MSMSGICERNVMLYFFDQHITSDASLTFLLVCLVYSFMFSCLRNKKRNGNRKKKQRRNLKQKRYAAVIHVRTDKHINVTYFPAKQRIKTTFVFGFLCVRRRGISLFPFGVV